MVASAQLLQTNIALSPRAHPRLHGLHHQHCHPIKRLLSLSFLHFVINVDFCLTCTLNIPAIIPHLCLSHRRTSKCTHWSSAFLLFHAHPLTHLQFHSCRTDSFSSKGPKISDLIVCHSQLLSLAKIQHWHTAGMILHCWHDNDQSCLLLLSPVAPSSDWVSSFLQHPHTASVHCRIWAHSSSSCSNHWHKALLLNSFKSLAHS